MQNYLMYEPTFETDPSGQLAWLFRELHAAERATERVYIIGHTREYIFVTFDFRFCNHSRCLSEINLYGVLQLTDALTDFKILQRSLMVMHFVAAQITPKNRRPLFSNKLLEILR
jgi:hypothetical protein